jgi:hypothetical protein
MDNSSQRIVRRTARAFAVITAASALSLTGIAATAAHAATGGDSNKGDVWVDNVGQPAGPGHEMDPHLKCQDINLWGDKLADSGGHYTIDGWPPSGAKKQAYASSWSYNRAEGGTQVLDVIDVHKLVAAAVANGDAPVNKQGLHFKLQFSQDPQKHKTFWVKCPATTPPPPPTGQVSLCQISDEYRLPPGTPVTFTVGTSTVTVDAGDPPTGNCASAGSFAVGSDVTITQQIPNGFRVDSLTVNPSNSVVSEDLSQGTVTIQVGTGTTTVSYLDR